MCSVEYECCLWRIHFLRGAADITWFCHRWVGLSWVLVAMAVAVAVVLDVGVVVHFHTNGGAFVIYAFRYHAGTACSRSTGTNFRTS